MEYHFSELVRAVDYHGGYIPFILSYNWRFDLCIKFGTINVIRFLLPYLESEDLLVADCARHVRSLCIHRLMLNSSYDLIVFE